MGVLFNMGSDLIKKAMDARKDTSKPGHTHSSEKQKPVYDKPPEVGGVSSELHLVLWVRIKLMVLKH